MSGVFKTKPHEQTEFKFMNHPNPLTNQQIIDLWTKTASSLNPEQFAKTVRAIEEAHGIK